MTAIAEEVQAEARERVLTLNDRCDAAACGAGALVQVKGVTGELLFCGHHYNKIVNDPIGYEKIMAFGFEIIDERWSMEGENRLKSDD
jgi:hypothetical protein